MFAPAAWYLIAIFSAAVFGALPPLFGHWTSRQLHLFIAFSAGIFLGAVFLHILPEVTSEGSSTTVNAMVLTGFMAILLVERVLLSQHERDCGEKCTHGHTVVGLAAMVGLSVHNISEGLSLGLGMHTPRLGFILFLAIIAHNSIAAFSLATVFRLAGFNRRRSIIFLGFFAASTPLAALCAQGLLTFFPFVTPNIPAALAAGTFLYVATCDLLPEAFHENHRRIRTFAALLMGIVIMLGIARLR